ncbi:MAG: 50S ribosomal protein L6 [Candidatus Hydrogenedentes bacterium]|nr:50S ribosomal protein L6 [Candidatus Hydrogenedentota bacterium]
MSRIGKLPVPFDPAKVKCELAGRRLKVTGPKGALEREFHPDVTITVGPNEVAVARKNDKGEDRALHGLTRALVQNMITGVTTGFEKTLKVEGVGYRASMQGKSLNLSLGYSHPILVEAPAGIAFATPDPATIKIAGIDKELVGQTAADVRTWRKPEPYKGKGIRYDNERIRRKVGKAGAK